MRAGFNKRKGFSADVALCDRHQKAFERVAKRLGITVPEAIALSAKLAYEAGVDPPAKEGRVVTFKALKSPGED